MKEQSDSSPACEESTRVFGWAANGRMLRSSQSQAWKKPSFHSHYFVLWVRSKFGSILRRRVAAKTLRYKKCIAIARVFVFAITVEVYARMV